MGKQGTTQLSGHSLAVWVAVSAERHARRSLKPYHLYQGAVMFTGQKGMTSVSPMPTVAEVATQAELWQNTQL